MTQYLLLDQQSGTLEKVFSGKFQKPQVDYLFKDTELADYKEQSPLLIEDTTATSNYRSFLEKNAGLIVTSSFPKERVIQQLKHILIVYVTTEHKGLFRYYDPYIASYFFTSLGEQETAQWLGPISRIDWYNITWRNRVFESDKWQFWDNKLVNNWQINQQKAQPTPILGKNQHLALQDMQEEKFAYHWQQNLTENTNNAGIDQVILWVKQGIQDGFNTEVNLKQYLAIRAKYPTKSKPEEWPTDNLEHRLIYLEHYFA